MLPWPRDLQLLAHQRAHKQTPQWERQFRVVCGQMVEGTASLVCNKLLLIVFRLDRCPILLQLGCIVAHSTANTFAF